jgi:osmotically-inducible protein OsmY
MKKMNLILVFALAAVLVPLAIAQDTNSQNSSTAATTQNANSSSAVSSESGSQDASLTQQLQNKFSQDPAFVNVQASVTNGTALITGTVASKADEKRAKDVAKSISGVKHVKDQLTVNPSAGASASKNNNQQDVSTGGSVSSPRTQSMSMPGATNPTNGETSATSTNPNSQASSATGSTASSSTMASQTTANPQTASQTPAASQPSTSTSNPAAPSTATPSTQTTAPNASTQASGSAATGENASSLPQSNASGEANMAGQTSTGAPSATSTPSTTGGVAGAATAPPASTAQSTTSTQSTQPNAIGANAGTPAAPSMATTGVGINDSVTLQSQIQNALQNEPTLHNDSLSVNVTDNTIELGGAVQTGKEKQTAHRIASSFAGNRRVKDSVTVSGHGTASSSPNSSTLGGNPASNSLNPQTNQNNPSNNAQNPSAKNPAANGDASTNPR